MIQNFEQVRAQLKELADVLNSYKSEAVQLRLVELIFDATSRTPAEGVTGSASSDQPVAALRHRAVRKRATRKTGAPAEDSSPAPKQRGANGKLGAKGCLSRLLKEGFFRTPQTIGQLVEHCDHHLASKLKSSDFSGSLARLTREKVLKRAKNGEGQYEYTQAS
jgi:hypothetical protein